jgi:twitching motility protein PilT
MNRIEELMEQVLVREASDLHLTAGVPPTLRIFGKLTSMQMPPLSSADVEELIYSIVSDSQKRRFEADRELDLSYAYGDKCRFRVNVYWQRGTMAAALRIIPQVIKTTRELGLPPIIEILAQKPRGFILVTGPTGCGKSTTLAAMLNLINRTRSEHILTIEDPIEFIHRHEKSIINQREVGTDTHSFSSALRHVLRQDPDVILVGEMRDLETISIALTAAETGHLVLATLHTQDAPQSIERIIDVFPSQQQRQIRIQLAGTLQAIVAQQLIPVRGGGDRKAAVEIMLATPAIRNMIRDQKTHQIVTAMQSGGGAGMQTMDQALANLVKLNQVSFDDALQRASDVDVFKRLAG